VLDEGGGSGLTIREADTIWREQSGWFDARWHVSFDRYRDPKQMGVGALRVFNDDRITAGAEWPMHPHRDIESLTCVVSGHFRHADSLGNNGMLRVGAAQVMTPSHGFDEHSEKNGSPRRAAPVHPVLDPAERNGPRDPRPAAPVHP
jgi:redox-sensitive bicupin YhaK (pirin superfamily)